MHHSPPTIHRYCALQRTLNIRILIKMTSYSTTGMSHHPTSNISHPSFIIHHPSFTLQAWSINPHTTHHQQTSHIAHHISFILHHGPPMPANSIHIYMQCAHIINDTCCKKPHKQQPPQTACSTNHAAVTTHHSSYIMQHPQTPYSINIIHDAS